MAKKTILVVEDEENIRELICLNLQKSGFEVLEAGTGERALEIFAERGEGIDMVMLDIMLPAKTQEMDKISGLEVGPFTLNLKSRMLFKSGQPVELTQVEYQIMELFLKNPDTVLGRMEILQKIWGDNYYGDDKIIDVNIRRLRMKIEEEPSHPRHINTVWGVGYRFKA